MEDYLLKQAEIDLLKSKGFNMEGVKAGDVAVAAEIKALNLNIPTQSFDKVPTGPNELPVNVPSDTPLNTVPAAATQTGPTPAAPQQMDPQILQQLLSIQEASQPKPISYDNLSKTQRRMMAFAGLSDAGAALSGQKGGSLDALMGRFNEAADMERKRQAAQAQQQLISNAIGGGADGNMQQAMLLLSNPATAALGQALLAQITAQAQTESTQTDLAAGASKTLDSLAGLIHAVRENPQATGFWGSVFRNVPFTKAGELKIDATTLRSNMALDALKQLKATGATLGSVSEKELELLEADIQLINLNQSQDKVLLDLEKIRDQYQSIIRKAYKTGDAAAITSALGGIPSWLDASSDTPAATSMQGKTWNPEAGRFE